MFMCCIRIMKLKITLHRSISFILDGIEAEEYTILIENDRLYPIIQKKIEHEG